MKFIKQYSFFSILEKASKKATKKAIKKSSKKTSKKTTKKVAKIKDTTAITIAKKRIYKETDEAYVCLTTTYGGDFFSMPKSQVISKSEDSIPINDVYSEAAYKFVITNKLFDKLFKDYFERMSDHNLIIHD